jgi:hypothetical protein
MSETEILALRLERIKQLIQSLEHACSRRAEAVETFARLKKAIDNDRKLLAPPSSPDSPPIARSTPETAERPVVHGVL